MLLHMQAATGRATPTAPTCPACPRASGTASCARRTRTPPSLMRNPGAPARALRAVADGPAPIMARAAGAAPRGPLIQAAAQPRGAAAAGGSRQCRGGAGMRRAAAQPSAQELCHRGRAAPGSGGGWLAGVAALPPGPCHSQGFDMYARLNNDTTPCLSWWRCLGRHCCTVGYLLTCC